MNRRQFIAGLAASTVPMAVVPVSPWQAMIDAEMFASFPGLPLPYKDPSAVFTDLVNAIQQTEKRIAVDLMNLEAT